MKEIIQDSTTDYVYKLMSDIYVAQRLAKCVSCGKKIFIAEFRDDQSVHNYYTTALCQSCQCER